jgi:cytidine deaminase
MDTVSTAPETYRALQPSEFLLGLTYGAGTETAPFQRLLRESLRSYGYSLRMVHLSTYLPLMVGQERFQAEVPDATRQLQDMGDAIRGKTTKDILAQLAAFLIASKRATAMHADGRVAWLVRSLKRKEEVETLRQLYGPRFILLSLHAPEPMRRRNLESRWQRWANVTSKRFDTEAAADIRRDDMDRAVDYGQGVRDAFSLGDFFIDARSESRLREVVPRSVRIIFGDAFEPPERDEQAMYHAFTAGLRSAEMGRQVGAAIVDARGDIVAVGTNEVPTGRGGLYWTPDDPDGRDFARQPPLDSNTLWQRRIARELLVRMAQTSWINKRRMNRLDDDYDISEAKLDSFLKHVEETRFRAITEFGRSVHAEMDAITSAARRGVRTDETTLACTTFPCHNCTRHIIASGIRRVIYVYPYAKSLARELHDDAIVIEPEAGGKLAGRVVFEQYVGVAPRVYPQYFSFPTDRKDPRGRAMGSPPHGDAVPRVIASRDSFSFGGPALPASRISELERTLIEEFRAEIKRTAGLQMPTVRDKEDDS